MVVVLAVNDDFVVPISLTMKVVGFFKPTSAATIAPELRDDLARRLGNGGGWTAVAAGAGGQAGVALKAANETGCDRWRTWRIAPSKTAPAA